MKPSFDLAVVGGGAAGLATAIFAARTRPDLRIAVLDGARSLGAKILVSGGGRCNVTNRHVVAADFNGGSRRTIARVLEAFSAEDTIRFFAQLGVALHEEPHGKMFPDSNRAKTVLDALLADCRARQIALRTNCRVETVCAGDRHFVLEGPGLHETAGRVVLATGGQSVPKTGSDGHGFLLARALGHTIVPTTPALVPLLLEDGRLAALAGVTHDATLYLYAHGRKQRTIRGSLLWTHIGISGPAALDISRHWLRAALDAREPEVVLDLTGSDFQSLDAWLLDRARTRPRALVATVLGERVPAPVGTLLAHRAGLEDVLMASLERSGRRALVQSMTGWVLPVSGSRGFTHAEATAGGVALTEIDPATMGSTRCAGLYLVGEMLDVDGRLGGFNFQWAWSSAYVAGRAAASLTA
ncbi:MAG: NAD(P)/FAD-dependent oxidoreductase [Vicinamibacterales bacterium]